MKGLNIDSIRYILNRDVAHKYADLTMPIRLNKDTIRLLRKLKKINKLKSLSAVVEMLIASYVLDEFTEEGKDGR